jgi:hypothetical protein
MTNHNPEPYIIARASTTEGLQIIVAGRMKLGYHPQGGVVMEHGGGWAQALVHVTYLPGPM